MVTPHTNTTSSVPWDFSVQPVTHGIPPLHYLGSLASGLIIGTTLVLGVAGILLNMGVVSYYWRSFKDMVPFIYVTLGLSDLCTGVCCLLHTVVFIMMLYVRGEDSKPVLWVSLPSFFITVVCFRLSAFVSMLFSIIRTINISNPFQAVNRKAVYASVCVYTLIWVTVLLAELSFLIKGGGITSSHFFRTEFYHSGSFTHIIYNIWQKDDAFSTQHTCIPAIVMTAMPTFGPALIALISCAIQVVNLVHPRNECTNPGARREKMIIGTTIVMITVSFFTCASFMLIQPLAECVPASYIPLGSTKNIISYVFGYMTMFLNAALNPLILSLRSRNVNKHIRKKLGVRKISLQLSIFANSTDSSRMAARTSKVSSIGVPAFAETTA